MRLMLFAWYADRKGSFLSSLQYLKKGSTKMAPHRSRLQSQHFRHIWETRPVQFRTPNWKHQVLPPIIKLTLFYLVLHICGYKYVQPKLFVVFCIDSIQNTTNLLLLAFPKKYSKQIFKQIHFY